MTSCDCNNISAQSADRQFLIDVPLIDVTPAANNEKVEPTSTSGGLSLISLNVLSIGKKAAAVCNIVASIDLDVLVLQETWHDNTTWGVFAELLRRVTPSLKKHVGRSHLVFRLSFSLPWRRGNNLSFHLQTFQGVVVTTR